MPHEREHPHYKQFRLEILRFNIWGGESARIYMRARLAGRSQKAALALANPKARPSTAGR